MISNANGNAIISNVLMFLLENLIIIVLIDFKKPVFEVFARTYRIPKSSLYSNITKKTR